MTIKPEYSPKVELGHLLQLAGLLLIFGVAVVPSYIGLRTDQARTDAQVSALASALSAANAATSLRQTADEHRQDVADQSLSDFEHEQRAAIAKIFDAIGDVKQLVGEGKHR